ncbi:MAG: type II secretion system protein [Deltaproteobacteria bacterium]|nr:type II secretion system protein [Deltaproteobacteria bacterium]
MNQKGFTLIEGVLSIALIGIALVGILYAFQGSVRSSLLADQTVIAANVARDTMEEIIAQKDCNESGCGYAATLSSISAQSYDANPVSGFAGYVLDTTALEVNPDDDNSADDFLDSQSGSGYARITVVVNWNNGGNSYVLETLLASY